LYSSCIVLPFLSLVRLSNMKYRLS
jgi:hypothetical protein